MAGGVIGGRSPPIVQLFMNNAYVSMQTAIANMLRRLSDWYDAKDIQDPTTRTNIRNLRIGKISPEAGLLDLANSSFKNGDYDNAEAHYRAAVDRAPNSWRATSKYAEFLRHARSNKVLAISYYNQALNNAPRQGSERALLFREFGLLVRDSGEPNANEQSLFAFREAFKETPNDPIVVYGLCSQLEKKGSYQECVNILSTMVTSTDTQFNRKCLPLLESSYRHLGEMLKAAETREKFNNLPA